MNTVKGALLQKSMLKIKLEYENKIVQTEPS